MSYKVFVSSGNDNNYYDGCRQVPGASLDSVYRCCLNKCGDGKICPALCDQIYPGTIFHDCVIGNNCWNTDVSVRGSKLFPEYKRECIQEKEQEIRGCCVNRCRNGQYSSNLILRDQVLPPSFIPDCNKFCNTMVNVSIE
jgi:hypothetical protein